MEIVVGCLACSRSCCCCCFSHSVHWLPTRKKLLYTVANPARGLLNREKKKKKSLAVKGDRYSCKSDAAPSSSTCWAMMRMNGVVAGRVGILRMSGFFLK